MTVRAVLLNCGNHADDKISVLRGKGDGSYTREASLPRGAHYDIVGSYPFRVETDHHGGDETCRQHEPAAIMSEGPGADLVRVTFNPSDSGQVDRIKTLAAALINEIEASEGDGRTKALAKTAIEEGAMWGVKAVTA